MNLVMSNIIRKITESLNDIIQSTITNAEYLETFLIKDISDAKSKLSENASLNSAYDVQNWDKEKSFPNLNAINPTLKPETQIGNNSESIAKKKLVEISNSHADELESALKTVSKQPRIDTKNDVLQHLKSEPLPNECHEKTDMLEQN